MADDFVSRLPIYEGKRSKDFPGFLIVRCGYDDCPGTKADRPFLVSEREWMRPNRIYNDSKGRSHTVIGRSCPYCFRTGRLPKRGSLR